MVRVRAVCGVLAVVLLCAGCAGGPALPDGWATFESDTLRVSYPGDWQIAEQPVEDGRQVEIRTGATADSLGAIVAPSTIEGLGDVPLDDYVEAWNNQMDSLVADRTVVRQEEFRLADGTPARWLEVTYPTTTPPVEGRIVREQVVLAVTGGRALVLRSGAEDERYLEFAETFLAIGRTFGPS